MKTKSIRPFGAKTLNCHEIFYLELGFGRNYFGQYDVCLQNGKSILFARYLRSGLDE
jgi:hypothetical protein